MPLNWDSFLSFMSIIRNLGVYILAHISCIFLSCAFVNSSHSLLIWSISSSLSLSPDVLYLLVSFSSKCFLVVLLSFSYNLHFTSSISLLNSFLKYSWYFVSRTEQSLHSLCLCDPPSFKDAQSNSIHVYILVCVDVSVGNIQFIL